jgi:anti-anti-sigma factor
MSHKWSLPRMENSLRVGDDLNRRGACLKRAPRAYERCSASDVSHSIHISRFEATLSRGGVAATITMVGQLDPSTRRSFTQKVREALDDDISLLVLDLEKVSFIDAAALSGLIQAFHQSQGRGIECEIKPSRCVQRILGLAGAPRELVGDPAIANFAEEERDRARGANSVQRSEAIAASSITAARGHVVRDNGKPRLPNRQSHQKMLGVSQRRRREQEER